MRAIGCALAVAASLFAAGSAGAQVRRPYDGIQAGIDAYRLAEEQRQAAVANQLAANDTMRAWSGLPPSRGYAMYYGYPGLYVPAVSREYAYAYGRPWYAPPTVFEPWPVVPGDIYGFTYVPSVRQPIGRWEGQTGPNRWESHPIYDPPLEAPVVEPQPLVRPKIVGPRADEAVPASPDVLDEVPPEPPAPVRRGREF